MRFCICISLPVSVGGVGPECCLSCHASISGEETHDWSLFWESLLTSRRPGPAMQMMWGTEVVVWSGKRFTVLCPTIHNTAPYLCNAISPDHSNSHFSFEMSLQIWCGSWCRADLPRRWSHDASLCQTLPVVSSQDLVSVSRVISSLDVQIHSCMDLLRLFFIMCQATSSVCIHLSAWVWRVWSMTSSVVVYPMPPISFGDVHG